MSSLQHLLTNFHKAILDKDAHIIVPELCSTGRLTPAQQMAIYIEGYRLRLLTALCSDYPELLALLGNETFHALARIYIEATPPVEASLNYYSFGFADFVHTQNADFAGALALLEGAIARAFLLPDSQSLQPDFFARLAVDDFSSMALHLRSSAILLMLDFPVEDYFSKRRAEMAVLSPQRDPSFMLIVRHENVVCRHCLHPVAFSLLSGLQNGLVLGDALERASSSHRDAAAVLSSHFQSWFAQWVLCGFFQPASE